MIDLGEALGLHYKEHHVVQRALMFVDMHKDVVYELHHSIKVDAGNSCNNAKFITYNSIITIKTK